MIFGKFFQASAVAGVSVVTISLPAQASVLQLGPDACFSSDPCTGSFTGGTYIATVTSPSGLGGVPTGANEDLIMGELGQPQQPSTSVSFTLIPDPNFRLSKVELFEPETFGGFSDVDDEWTATLGGANWNSFATDGNNSLDGGDVGVSTAIWTGTNPLATVNSADTDWFLAWNGLAGGPLTLDITYRNLSTFINNADGLRIHVEGVFRPVIVSAPEPSSIIGLVTLAFAPVALKSKRLKDISQNKSN